MQVLQDTVVKENDLQGPTVRFVIAPPLLGRMGNGCPMYRL